MIHIKICGLTEPEQAIIAAEGGADYLGMVLAPSRRQIAPEKATSIVQSLRQRKLATKITGVFVNAPAEEVNRTAAMCDLDWVQLSGDESWDYCRNIERPIIKAIHVFPGRLASYILREIEEGKRLLSGQKFVTLLDTQAKNAYGGTGQAFDWQLAREISLVCPVFVAGGLTLQNIGQLVREVQPWGVDVSSGVETNGIKDSQKIQNFINIVKANQE